MSASGHPSQGSAGTLPPAAQPPEQRRYAAWMRAGSLIGIVLMLIGFGAYALELGAATVRPSMLPHLWTLSAAELTRLHGSPVHWSLGAILGSGDTAALAGVAILAGCALPGLLALVPLYLRRGDRAFAALCLAEAAVILLAASGWLAGGR